MNREQRIEIGVVASLALLVAAVDWRLHDASYFHIPAAAGLVVGAAYAARRSVDRRPIVLSAAAGTALWLLLQDAPDRIVAAAYLPTALLLWAPPTRLYSAALVGGLAALLMLILVPPSFVAVLVAFAVAGLAVLARPSMPTVDALRTLRSLSLFLPSLGLAAALTWSAATRFSARFSNLDAVLFGTGLFLLLALFALGLLGLTTLMESDHPLQGRAWNSLSVLAGCLVAAAVTLKDPGDTLGFLALAAPATGLLAGVFFHRLLGRWLPAHEATPPPQDAPAKAPNV